MAREHRDPVRERRWRERLAHWQSSGLAIREFCLRHGLRESAFHDWQRELRTRDGQSTSPPSSPSTSPSSLRPTFVPLTDLPNRVDATTRAVRK